MASKALVVYLKVFPHMDPSSVVGRSSEKDIVDTPAAISVALYCTGIVYTMLMFRAQKPLFGSMSTVKTPDVVVHQDMLWHVVLDIIDAINMVQYSRLQDWIEGDVIEGNWAALDVFRRFSCGFVFLALMGHSQSFPLCEWRYKEVKLDPEWVLELNEEMVGNAVL